MAESTWKKKKIHKYTQDNTEMDLFEISLKFTYH